MEVNFLITCFNKEHFADFYRYTILKQFKKIVPKVTLAYNGIRPFYPCDVSIPNRGLQLGEYDLILSAFRQADKTVTRFIKLSADSWLCNEDKIIEIFQRMEKDKCGYAGNYWFPGPHPHTLSTDIFFLDTRFGSPMFHLQEPIDKPYHELEFSMYKAVQAGTKALIIQEREPTHPTHRNICEELQWTMQDDFVMNLSNYKRWKHNSNKIQTISGNPMSHGLGDTFLMTAVTQQEPCLVQVPPHRKDFVRLFRDQAYTSVTEKLVGSPEVGNDLWVNRRLRAFGLDTTRNLPYISFTTKEVGQILEIRNKYPKAVILKTTSNNTRGQNWLPDFSIWDKVLTALKKDGYTILQTLYSAPPDFESPPKHPLVDVELKNLPLSVYALYYAAIPYFLGVDTGDHHLHLACGGINVMLYPSLHAEMKKREWHYVTPKCVNLLIDNLNDNTENIVNYFNSYGR